jgi:hypothetical protein
MPYDGPKERLHPKSWTIDDRDVNIVSIYSTRALVLHWERNVSKFIDWHETFIILVLYVYNISIIRL